MQLSGISRQHGATAAHTERRRRGRRALLCREIRSSELHHAAAALGDETVGIVADLVTARSGQAPQLQTVARDLQRPHDLARTRTDPHVDVRAHAVEAHLGNIVLRPFRGVDRLPVRQRHVVGTVRKTRIGTRIRKRGVRRNGRGEIVEIVRPAAEHQLPRSVRRGIATLIDSRGHDRAIGVGDLVSVLIHRAGALRVGAGLVDHHAERRAHGKTVGIIDIRPRIGTGRKPPFVAVNTTSGEFFPVVGRPTVHVPKIMGVVDKPMPNIIGIIDAGRRGPVTIARFLPCEVPELELPVVGQRRIGPDILDDLLHLVIGRKAKTQIRAVLRGLRPRHLLLHAFAAVAVNPQVTDLERTIDHPRRGKARTRGSSRRARKRRNALSAHGVPAVIVGRSGDRKPAGLPANRNGSVGSSGTAVRTAHACVFLDTARQRKSARHGERRHAKAGSHGKPCFHIRIFISFHHISLSLYAPSRVRQGAEAPAPRRAICFLRNVYSLLTSYYNKTVPDVTSSRPSRNWYCRSSR